MEKFKCSTGREVELMRPTVDERIKCRDIAVTRWEGNVISIEHSFESLANWAAVGLGTDIDGLNDYSDTEITEIGNKVRELSELGTTTPTGSKSTPG